MLVVNAGGKPKRSERQLRDACASIPGILILNALIQSAAGRTREVDGVVLTQTGTFVVEVKGTQLSGVVTPDANRPWTVGGTPADFYGGPNPLRQARSGAQALASTLRESNIDAGFVTPIVAVVGDDLTLQPSKVGDTWATLAADIAGALTTSRARTLSADTAAAVCSHLGVTVAAADIEAQGFERAGSHASRVQRNSQLRDLAATSLQAVCAPLPGLLIFPGDKIPTGADQHAILLAPTGVFAIKAKATTLRGSVVTDGVNWTIGGTEAHLGRGRPEAQARSMAAWFRKSSTDQGIRIKVTGVVTLTGTDLEVAPHKSHGAWVCRTEDLAGVLLRNTGYVSLEQARAICDELDYDVTDPELVMAGFTSQPPEPVEKPAPQPGRQERRLERLAQTQRTAHHDWRVRNIRRIVGSAVSAVFLVTLATLMPVGPFLYGVATAALFGFWQQTARRRFHGPRDVGYTAVALWVLTLAPIAGLGSVVAGAATLHAIPVASQPGFLALLLLHALLFGATLLLGRSSFIYPPAAVMERYDSRGRATGTFALVPARVPVDSKLLPPPAPMSGDWRVHADLAPEAIDD